MNDEKKELTGYASIDKPWMKWHDDKYKDIEISNDNFFDYFMNQIYTYPKDTILLDCLGKKKYTGSDIEKEVSKQIKMFTNLGVKDGDVVSFMMVNSPEIIFMFLALNKMGAIANLIKYDESPERINYMLNLTNSKYFFISDKDMMISNAEKVLSMNQKLEKVIKIPVMESIEESKSKRKEIEEKIQDILNTTYFDVDAKRDEEEYLKLKELNKELSCEIPSNKMISYGAYKEKYLKPTPVHLLRGGSDRTTLIVYTGGSTGAAKGVELTNKNLVAMAHGEKYSNYGYNYPKKSLNVLYPSIAYYLNATCGLMICGLTVSLQPDFDVPDIPNYPNFVNNNKPNFIFSGPILLKLLAMSDVKDLSYLLNPISGGDKLDASEEVRINEVLKSRGSETVQQGYGTSEAAAIATCNPMEPKKVGSIGIPMINVNMSIFEYQTDKEIPYGHNQEGEICISGPTVMKGYLNNPEATEASLVKHNDGQFWFHTDDIGVMDEDGYIYHKGRYKRMLTRSGNKLWLTDLDDKIMQTGLVQNCCSVKLDDEMEREVPVVHVVLNEEYDENEVIEKLNSYIKDNCPPFYLPKYYIIKEELPYTKVNKKLDFKTLEKENILNEDEFIINGNIIKPRTKVKKLI